MGGCRGRRYSRASGFSSFATASSILKTCFIAHLSAITRVLINRVLLPNVGSLLVAGGWWLVGWLVGGLWLMVGLGLVLGWLVGWLVGLVLT